ncbi:MAG: mechanosensitive ion channel protein MscS [Hyphococcus sp.]|nr:MAG: mechanosensitive ion channel protein MscS [Marinicaulis sp.]
MKTRLISLFLIAFSVAVFSHTAQAQTTRSQEIENAKAAYSEVRAALDEEQISNADVLKEQLRSLRDASRQRLTSIERELDGIRGQLEPLGPAPGENAPPESEELAAERAALNQEFVRLNSQRTRVNANIIEANDLLNRLSASQLQSLYSNLLNRGQSLIDGGLWANAYDSIGTITGRITQYFSGWSERKAQNGDQLFALFFIAGALLISILLFGPVDRWIISTFSNAIAKRRPTSARRVVVAGLKMIARTAPGLLGGFIIIETLRAQGVITEQGEPAVRTLWFALLVYLLISGFTRGLFSPANPRWRIASLEASRGQRVTNLVIAIVILFGLKLLLVDIIIAAGGATELITITRAIVAIVIGALLFLLCRTNLWRGGFIEETDANERPKSPDRSEFWRIIRRIGRVVSILIIVFAVTGYVTFADFIVSRFYYLAIFFTLAWFTRALLTESAFWLRNRLKDPDNSRTEAEEEHQTQNFKFWSGLLANVGLLIALIPALLVLFGLPAATVRDISAQALFGFDIGRVHIPSIANIAFGLLVFVLVMMVTKLVQRGFQRGVFAHSNIDDGIQNSLTTLMGYAGLVIAIFASVSTIGFDLSNLALIAGALSVGIGFGLQSIVNNFVSGLILLFERPIKAGDWIVTASGEGTVKRISVRSTEIITFDRSSIIVPNSELISSTVTNWTHKDKIGRIIIPIGVSYGANPEKVRDILLKCANDHPLIVRYPEAFVVWQGFGDSSLDFELRAFLADISTGLRVRSELRFAIFKALNENGIEIPFPQRDLHVKSWPEGVMLVTEQNSDA